MERATKAQGRREAGEMAQAVKCLLESKQSPHKKWAWGVEPGEWLGPAVSQLAYLASSNERPCVVSEE